MAGIVEHSEVWAHVNKISGSHALRDCDSLQQLLQFLTTQTLEHPDSPPKEQEIAEKVFSQQPGFDPRLDSRVRVHIKRLREKLAKYYEDSGTDDRIMVQIPKGSHSVYFWYRGPVTGSEGAASPALLADTSHDTARMRLPGWRWTVLGLLLLGIGLLIGKVAYTSRPDAALRAFWQPFLTDPPLLVYGNIQIQERSPGILGPVNSAVQGEPLNDSLTGVGEVVAASELTDLFRDFGTVLNLRRALNVSWEEAKSHNLVFVGAYGAAIRALPQPETFAFRGPNSTPPAGATPHIVNLRPQPGEPLSFPAGPLPCCRPTTLDHAIIMFAPALAPKRYTLVVAGVTTLGTEEAVSFLCRPASVRTLLSRVPAGAGGGMGFFEAVLRIRISGGAPVSSELAAVHARNIRK